MPCNRIGPRLTHDTVGTESLKNWFDVVRCAAAASTFMLGGCYAGPGEAAGGTDSSGMTDGALVK